MEQATVDSGVAISIPMPLILRGHDKATTQFPQLDAGAAQPGPGCGREHLG